MAMVVNDRDATSAILLSSPGIWYGASGDAWHTVVRMANALSKWAAIRALDACSFVVHPTVGVLSHPTAMWACVRSATCSSTSHWHNIPAISRSEFEIWPLGFV